ncbi:MAG: hypothetical protein AAF499_05145, partial [Pseudomonadota bacterium]
MANGSKKPPIPHRSLRAVKEFNCLGGDCPDTCCKSWRIELDRDDYMRWRKAAKGSAETLALFKDSVKRVRGAEKIFAQIKIEKHGDACPAYSADGLCQVQKNHGHKTIPYIASYPWIAPPADSPLYHDLRAVLESIGVQDFKVAFT